MASWRPTPEQEAAVAAFKAGQHVVLQAGAGSGKTSTLRMLAFSTRRRGRSIVFNKSIALEARRKFPHTVACSTAHALAYVAVGKHYQQRLDAPRMSSAKLAQVLGIRFREVRIGEKKLTAAGLCYTAQDTMLRYCQSADLVLGRQHVPWLKGIGEQHLHEQLVDLVLPYAQRMWADLQNPDEVQAGPLPEDVGADRPTRRSMRTFCCWTRPRTPTRWSSRWSPLNAATRN